MTLVTLFRGPCACSFGPSCCATLRRVARPTEHSAVGDVERSTARCERHDVIDGQVARRVGVTLVARAPIAMLAAPGAEHAGAEALPCPRAVHGVVSAAVGLAGMVSAATAGAAGRKAAHRAELHGPRRPCAVSDLTLVTLDCTPVEIAMSVSGRQSAVYSPPVQRLEAQRVAGLTPSRSQLPAAASSQSFTANAPVSCSHR